MGVLPPTLATPRAAPDTDLWDEVLEMLLDDSKGLPVHRKVVLGHVGVLESLGGQFDGDILRQNSKGHQLAGSPEKRLPISSGKQQCYEEHLWKRRSCKGRGPP